MIYIFQLFFKKSLGCFLIIQVIFSGLVFAAEFEKCQGLYAQHLYLHKKIDTPEISPEIKQLHQELHEQQMNEKKENKLSDFHNELHKQQEKFFENKYGAYH